MDAVVTPAGEIVISSEEISALQLQAGDRVSVTITPETATSSVVREGPAADASLDTKVAFYKSPELIDAVTERFRTACASVLDQGKA
jgi:hypothetical protein